MPLLFCSAQPADIEGATAIAAVTTAAFTPPLLEQPTTMNEGIADKAELASGPHLSEAIREATAADCHMVAVPVSSQHVRTLTDPGINAAFLPGQSSISAAPQVPAEGPEQEPPPTIAAVVAVAGSTTVVASERSGDDTGLAMVSGVTAATASAVFAVAGGDNNQDVATASATRSEVATPGTSQPGLVSITAASSLATAAATYEAEGGLGSAITEESLQAAPGNKLPAADEQAGSPRDEELSQLSSLTSQPAKAVHSDSEQQAGIAAAGGDESWRIPAQGQQPGASEDESGLMMSSSSGPPVMPSVKQSVSRLEKLHAAMRNKP